MKRNKPPRMPTMMNPGHQSDMQTPGYAIEPLLPYIPKDWLVWECASGKGNLVDAFLMHGYKVIWSDIIRQPSEDFYIYQPKRYAVIVTNPPYDQKDKFIARAYELGKPWAFLMPVTALGGSYRQSMYRKYGLQVMFLNGRINFEVPSGGTSPWFETAWFTHGFNLPRDMMFVDLKHPKKERNGKSN